MGGAQKEGGFNGKEHLIGFGHCILLALFCFSVASSATVAGVGVLSIFMCLWVSVCAPSVHNADLGEKLRGAHFVSFPCFSSGGQKCGEARENLTGKKSGTVRMKTLSDYV